MARLIVGVAGAVVGYFVTGGNPVGALQGFTIAYGLSAGLDPNTKVLGPKLNDLKAPQASYGAPIPYVEGAPRLAGCYIWASDKREVANTTSSGGKGGPGVDSTTFTYEIDCLIELAINRCQAIRRVWSNGRLVWSNADDADADTLLASSITDSWRDLRFYDGADDQLPDPTYEAAVGVGNAPAYRGRTTVMVEGMNLGGSGQLPILTFEVVSQAEVAANVVTIGETVFPHSYTFGGGIPAFSNSGFRYHAGQWDSGYASTSVLVYQVADDGSNTLYGTYDVDTPFPAAKGNSDESCLVISNGSDEITYYFGDTGNRLYFQMIPGETLGTGGQQVRFSKVGDDMVVGGYSFGSKKIYRFAKSIPGGYQAVSVAMTGFAQAIAIGSGVVYVLEKLGANVWQLNLTTLALDATFATPAVGSNGTIVCDESGSLYYADDSSGDVSKWNGATWDLVFDAVNAVVADMPVTNYGFADSTFFSAYGLSAGIGGTVEFRKAVETTSIVLPTLAEVVTRLTLRTGLLTVDDIDVTELESDYVRALAITQVSTTRVTLEMLMSWYLFECVEGEKIRFVKRGGASVVTIPYDDLAAGQDGKDEPLPLKRINDIEVAARFSVKYANVSNDFQDGIAQADRLVTESTAEAVVEFAIGATPAEAAKVADSKTLDAAVSLLQIGPAALTRKYSYLEPTDVVTLTNSDGSTFRARIVKGTIGGGIHAFDFLLDDATVVNSVAETDEDYASSTLVRLVAETILVPMDIAPLTDSFLGPGYMAAFSAEGSWGGAQMFESLDDISYSKVFDVGSRAVLGTATSVLPDFTGGNVFDEVSTLTVDVGTTGTLSSSTRTAMLAANTVNALAVGSNEDGWEVVQFRTATMTAPGLYTLSGFLRGLRGTEWMKGEHVAAEHVVLLQTSGLKHVDDIQSDLNVPYYLKAVSRGRNISTASTQVFTDTGVSLKPFAPVDFDYNPLSATPTIAWHRRSRVSGRLFATVGDPPLGEDSESYDVEHRDSADVLKASATVSTASYSATSVVAGDYVTVWQRSGAVGRGYPTTITF